MRIPTAIKLHKASRTLELEYGADERYVLPAEFLRVHSPSAEVQGHGNPVLQTGKLKVALEQIEPAGQYALKLTFSDGHDSGLYTWDYLERGAESAGAVGRLSRGTGGRRQVPRPR